MSAPGHVVNTRYPQSEFLSLTEVAEFIGCGRGSVQNLINSGRLPAYRIAGTMWRVKRSDLEAAIVPAGGAE